MADIYGPRSLFRRALCSLGFALLLARVEAIYFQNTNFDMVVGQSFGFSWNYLYGQAQLTLGGAGKNNTNLNITIGMNLGKSHFLWTPPSSIQTGLYILELQDFNSVDWSPVFTITNYGNQTYLMTTKSASSTPTQPASSSPTPTTVSSTSSRNLAADIGIGIGAALGASLNLGVIGFAIWWKRKRDRDALATQNSGDGGEVQPLTGQKKDERRGLLEPMVGWWRGTSDTGNAREGKTRGEEDEITLVGSSRASLLERDDPLDSVGGDIGEKKESDL